SCSWPGRSRSTGEETLRARDPEPFGAPVGAVSGVGCMDLHYSVSAAPVRVGNIPSHEDEIMKTLKKSTGLWLALALTCTLPSACGGDDDPSDVMNDTTGDTTVDVTTDQTPSDFEDVDADD